MKKYKKKYIYLILALILLLTGCSNKTNDTIDIFEKNGIKYTSKIENNKMQVFSNGKWNKINIKSVNINNYYPGREDTNVTKEEFLDWMDYISDMNANTIKIMDIYPHAFYEALLEFNKNNDKPLYLIQSIKMDTKNFKKESDVFKLDNLVPFHDKLSTAVEIIHGNITVPDTYEKDWGVSGTYSSDISQYVIAWEIGSKWDPNVINHTNNQRIEEKNSFNGKFVRTIGDNTSPFEVFIAESMEHILSYEMDRFNWQRPISFLNTPRTDIINHPYEPESKNNLVSLNPNNIEVINDDIGYFATYSVFPYYPEFINMTPKYNKFLNYKGEVSPFSAYLKDLKEKHDMPIFIGEFGLPTSRGIARVSTNGMNKGGISEVQQGYYISSMYDDLIYYGYMGGSVTTWQDSWNKRAWNIRKLDNPDNLDLWQNSQNASEYFGIMKFVDNKITIDGNFNDWKKLKIEPFYESPKDDSNKIDKVYIHHDHSNIYIGVKFKKIDGVLPNVLLFLDTVPNQGNKKNNIVPNIETENENEFLISIQANGNSGIFVDSYYDTFYHRNSKIFEHLQINEEFDKKNNGIFNPIKQTVNDNIINENTSLLSPFMDVDLSYMNEGSLNKDSDKYNSKTDYSFSKKDEFLEIKIPWGLINFTNPVNKEVIGDIKSSDGLETRTQIEGIGISIAAYYNDESTLYSFPESKNNIISKGKTYKWNSWSELELEENLKDSYEIIQKTFNNY